MNERIYTYEGIGDTYIKCYPPGHFPAKYGESKIAKHVRLTQQTFVIVRGEENIFEALGNETI